MIKIAKKNRTTSKRKHGVETAKKITPQVRVPSEPSQKSKLNRKLKRKKSKIPKQTNLPEYHSSEDELENHGETEEQNSEASRSENEFEADNSLDSAGTDTESDPESRNEDEQEDSNANAAWADAISKVLKSTKPKKKKTLVLSRAKKLTDEKPKVKGDEEIDEEVSEKPQKKKRKKQIPTQNLIRIKPVKGDEYEKALKKIATMGVVKLFNAVSNQQKEIECQLTSTNLEREKEKVLKGVKKQTFLEQLSNQAKSQPVEDLMQVISARVSKSENVEAKWNVLRDDFLMNAKLKDWDKKEEEEEIEEMNIEED